MARREALAPMLCAALLALYAVLAWTSVSTKSPTFDEPLHALAGSIALEQRDFRIDFDNPPLWKYWAALPSAAAPAHIDTGDRHWRALPFDLLQQWPFAMQTLYRDPHNDPDRLIGRARFMMLLWAVALGALTARWAFELAGAAASLATTALFALDPNFLAHGPLVKNDVAIALLLLALAYAVWRSGARITWRGALAIGLLCGAGCAVKLSGIVLPVAACLVLLVRALRAGARAQGDLRARARPLLAAVAALAGAALMTVGVIWAVYGFRFGVSPDPAIAIDTRRIAAALALAEGSPPHSAGAPSWPERAVVWSLDHRCLPEPWLAGLLFAHAGTRRRAYLLGDFVDAPWSGYLPRVFLFKTPAATLAAFAAALAMGVARWRSRRPTPSENGAGAPRDRDSLACLAIPPLVYALFALGTPAASGVRHLLPLYPFLFIGSSIAAARAWRASSGRLAVVGIAALLAVESIWAYPDYLSFFPFVAGGERGGVRLLGDSNLDWGQDLPRLAAWQREHPEVPLALAYFGTADPAHYGIRYTNLPGGNALGPEPRPPSRPGVVAISATILQGLRVPGGADPYAPFRVRQPIAVLGGSIYLYALPGD